MKIAFNPSTVAALITPPNNKDITFDLRGRNIFARGVKFCGTDTNTWRDIKINNVSIGSNILDLRDGGNTTLTNTNGVVTINSTWRPVVDNLTSDSTTSSLSAKQGKILKSLIDGKSNSGHTHDDRYLKLTGGTMASNALITFADSSSWGTDKGPQEARGGLYWTGQSDYAKLYAEETAEDNLDLVIQFGNDNSNGLSIRNKANTQTSYISASGVITTGTFKGNLDWSYITNKPSSYTPSAHTHTWNSLTHSSTTENQAILTNGKANGWKLYTLNIARWDNAANNAHSHANKSVLDGITSGLVNNWNTAYNFVSSITGTDADKVINKWDEIVNFLAGITEDNKLNTLLNSKLSVYELANNANVGTIKNNGIYYSTTDGSSGTLTNSPFNTGFALINMTSFDNGDDLRRSRLAFNAYGEIKVSDDRGQSNTAETWYNVLTSKNSGISGSTIKLNGTSITVYSSSTADGRYVKKSGDTMSGVLTIGTTNFGALTIQRNDDANEASIQFRGKSSVYGYIGLNNSTKDKQFLRWNSDTSKTYTILDTSSTYTSNGKGVINGTTITQVDNATNSTNSTNSTNARKLVNWYSTRPTSLNTQFSDGSLRIFYATSSTTVGKCPSDASILHLAWDCNRGFNTQLALSPRNRMYFRGQSSSTWHPWETLAFTTDIPTSLKSPYSLTLKANGTILATYDGSSAKEANFTYANVGAASASHTHSYITISTCSSLNGNSNNFSVEYASGGNSVATKPSGVDAFGVMRLCTAYGWYGQILMSNSNGIYYRSANGLTSSVNWIKLLDSSNSNVSGGGNTWGSSITVNINGTSKTLTIPNNPNTDYRVTQSETTTANYRPLVVGYTNVSTAGSGMTGSVTNQVYLSNKFYVQPSTGNLYATNFVGALSGNASTATNADKVDGYHASGLLTALSNSNYGVSITVGGTTKSISNISVDYAYSAGSATEVIVNQHTANDTNYPLVWSNQANSSTIIENQLYKSWSDLYYNPKNKRLTVGGSVVASSFVERGGTSQQLLRADGGIATFNWSGQSGQPTWLWGGNNEHSYYVYNPSNFRVAYATSAGSADTAQYLRSLGNQNCQTGRTQNYGDVYTYNTYDGNTGSPTTFTSVIGFGRGIAGTVEIAGGWDNTNLYWRSLSDCCEDWHSWRTVLDSSNYTKFINNYYWANVKISTSSSTTTSPTVSNLTATSSIRMGNIYLQNTNEINSVSDIHLNYQNSGNISLCYGGGKVGIGTTSPTYKLDVNGQMKASGFHHSSMNSDNYILLAGGGYKSFGGDSNHPVFLGYLNLDHGSDGTVSSSFYCLGYSVPFTYTRGGNYCKISIPDTTHQVFYIKAAIASVNYSGGGMDTWTGNHNGAGAWWLHCYAPSSNEVRVKGFHLKNSNNDSWWGGNPLWSDRSGVNRITVCIFGYVTFR